MAAEAPHIIDRNGFPAGDVGRFAIRIEGRLPVSRRVLIAEDDGSIAALHRLSLLRSGHVPIARIPHVSQAEEIIRSLAEQQEVLHVAIIDGNIGSSDGDGEIVAGLLEKFYPGVLRIGYTANPLGVPNTHMSYIKGFHGHAVLMEAVGR
jgi:hypothetical protein